MKTRPLSPALGVEITGIQLNRDLYDAERQQVLDAFRRYHLLLFRKQDISHEQQKHFAEIFGPLASSHINSAYVSNNMKGSVFGEGELLFHSDHTYLEIPDTRAILLYAVEVPTSGGDTLFVNAQLAYRELPDDLKARITELHAVHAFDPTTNRGDRRFTASNAGPNLTKATHPIVWCHPENGSPILFISQLLVDRIVELNAGQSEELREILFSHLYLDRFQYKHKWSVGDLIIWDNHSLQHARTTFDPSEKRTLRRSPIAEI